MLRKPVIKAHYKTQLAADKGTFLLAEGCTHLLRGHVYESLIPLLDGTRNEDDIIAALGTKYFPAEVYYAIDLLEQSGYLTEAAPHVPQTIRAFWDELGKLPTVAQAALTHSPVRVHVLGDADPEPLNQALAQLGIQCIANHAMLDIVLTDNYLNSDLLSFNADMRLNGKPWLVLRLRGHESWLGPLYLPDDIGCHHCLAHRLERNLLTSSSGACKIAAPTPLIPALSSLPTTQQAAAALAATEIAKHIVGVPCSLRGTVVTLNHLNLCIKTHRILPAALCPECRTGQRARADTTNLRLARRKVQFADVAGHRSVAPEEILDRYAKLVSPITGVVRRLERIRENESAVYVYVAEYNSPHKEEEQHSRQFPCGNLSAGKGTSDVQAKVSALCEAIEHFSGARHGSEVSCTTSFAEMRLQYGADVLHPNFIMQFSESQYANRELLNATASNVNYIPERLDETIPIDWSVVWSLTENRPKYLPTQLLYFQSPASSECSRVFAIGCSNGSAAGNNPEEAILQGLLEVIERDAIALWWYNRLRRPGIAVETFNSQYLNTLTEVYTSHRRETWALDLTSDLGVPVIAAISRLLDAPSERILFGFGCHLDPRIALHRAFTEMNQMLGFARDFDETPVWPPDYKETVDWLRTATVQGHPYLLPDIKSTRHSFWDFRSLHSVDFLDEITTCQRIIEDHGMELLVLDQTIPDIGLPVVKVIVPGLRHFWARHAPGRLYDVPVKMGWTEQPTKEADLNPTALFL